jgi:hypothetical protein
LGRCGPVAIIQAEPALQTLPANLQPDCARCIGLCCVAPPFDADQGFGFDKPAHTACKHLNAEFRCSIHAQLVEQGFPACASFDCYGAGQLVTAQFAPRGSWRSNAELAAEIFESYQRMRTLHELLAMATLALDRAETADQVSALRAVQQELDEAKGTAASFDVMTLRKDVLRRIRECMKA